MPTTRNQEKFLARAATGPMTRSRAALLARFTVGEIEAAEALLALRSASVPANEPAPRPRRAVANYRC